MSGSSLVKDVPPGRDQERHMSVHKVRGATRPEKFPHFLCRHLVERSDVQAGQGAAGSAPVRVIPHGRQLRRDPCRPGQPGRDDRSAAATLLEAAVSVQEAQAQPK